MGLIVGLNGTFHGDLLGQKCMDFFEIHHPLIFQVDNLDYFPYVSFTAHGRSILMTWRFKPSPFRPADPRRGSQKSDIWIQGDSISRMDFPFHELTHPAIAIGVPMTFSDTSISDLRRLLLCCRGDPQLRCSAGLTVLERLFGVYGTAEFGV